MYYFNYNHKKDEVKKSKYLKDFIDNELFDLLESCLILFNYSQEHLDYIKDKTIKGFNIHYQGKNCIFEIETKEKGLIRQMKTMKLKDFLNRYKIARKALYYYHLNNIDEEIKDNYINEIEEV